VFMQLLRSDKNRDQKECDAGGEGRPGTRQPPPHAEGLTTWARWENITTDHGGVEAIGSSDKMSRTYQAVNEWDVGAGYVQR
jgi:hypothetical protein